MPPTDGENARELREAPGTAATTDELGSGLAEPREVAAPSRRLGVDDAPRLAQLDAELFGAEAWSLKAFEEELASPFRVYRGIEMDGQVVAVAGMLLGPTAEILTVGTDPNYQRRGLARALVAELIEEARGLGTTEVFLEVRSDDDGAIALYAGLGFRPITIRRGYYQSSGKDALIMRLDLSGE